MSREHFEKMLDYYQQEMMYLRQSGGKFSAQYPKVAQHLNLSERGSTDPHVQRLLESFAFLTGSLQKELDNSYIQFTSTLLSALYPQFTSPFPAASVASFRLSPQLGKTTAGYTVPQGTSLFTETLDKKICRFQTAYPVELWPFEVSDACLTSVDETSLPSSLLETRWALKIRVQRYDGPLHELSPSHLRFYLSGDSLTTQCLYESILGYLSDHPTPVFLQADTATTPTALPPGSLNPVGFKPEEALIPSPETTFDGYRLLYEFFVFPNKFKYLDIENFSTLGAKKYVDIYIPLADLTPTDKLFVKKNNFLLGCTPILNLFPKISEPINLNYQSVSYRLIGDQRNEDTTEIHTIQKVVAAAKGGEAPHVYAPYFSYDYETENADNGLFWHATRKPSETPNVAGTDVFLSFVDYNFTPQTPSQQNIYAYTLCTNRDLASYISPGTSLQVDGAIPPATITCLEQPTPEILPALDVGAQWRLISQLSLNHLSLSGPQKAISALKELLHLYSGLNKSKSSPEIKALHDITYQPTVRRKGLEAWRGFIQGLSINLVTTEAPFSGQGGYMLASVLNDFFSQYVSLESFIELTFSSTRRDKVWKKWPAKIGKQPLL